MVLEGMRLQILDVGEAWVGIASPSGERGAGYLGCLPLGLPMIPRFYVNLRTSLQRAPILRHLRNWHGGTRFPLFRTIVLRHPPAVCLYWPVAGAFPPTFAVVAVIGCAFWAGPSRSPAEKWPVHITRWVVTHPSVQMGSSKPLPTHYVPSFRAWNDSSLTSSECLGFSAAPLDYAGSEPSVSIRKAQSTLTGE